MAAVASGSGTNGVRMRKLRQTLNKALDQCFLKVKLDTFHSAMPSISESHRDAIDDLGVQLMETLRLNIEEEFENICREADIAAKLNRLDQLVADKGREATGDAGGSRRPRPATVMPDGIIRAIQAARLKQQADALQLALTEMDAGNEALEEQVRVMDTEVREISAKAKADAEALEDAGAAAEEFVRDKEAAEAAASSAT